MKVKLIAVILTLALAAVAARAQTVNPNIKVTGQGGAPECTVGQVCVATGANWLLGYGNDAAKAAVFYSVFSIMPDGREIPAHSVWPNIGRLNFSPDLSAAGAVAYRFKSQFLDQVTKKLDTPTPTFSPVINARGVACYDRPSPGACESFNGTLVFRRGVGHVALKLEAGGLGAFSDAWTLVVDNGGASSETATFAVEFPAKSFPASSANQLFDILDTELSRPQGPGSTEPSVVLTIWAYRTGGPNGTIVKTPRVSLVVVFESD